MANNIQTVISQSESVLMAGFESSFRASHFMILLVVFGASTLPTWGKHVIDSTDFTRIGLFTDSFFDDISLVRFGCWFWIQQDLQVLGHFLFP